jgi:hypothetical protein
MVMRTFTECDGGMVVLVGSSGGGGGGGDDDGGGDGLQTLHLLHLRDTSL